MKGSISIKKVLVAALWLAIAGGVTTLLVAANSRQDRYVCKKVVVSFRGEGGGVYLDKNDILASLKRENEGRLVRRPLSSIDLARLEKNLEKNPWVARAELYFDSREVLHVSVTERQPVARVFTISGRSFYLDTGAVRMPLLDRVTIRVPVVSNFPSSRKLTARDSLLLNDVKEIATYVSNHPFWRAQIAQIDITPGRNFELLPTLGNHVIRIGKADNLEQKLNRLFLFYRQVASKTGFDRYGVLDVQYEGQVVAVHKGIEPPVDSVTVMKNIRELLRKSVLNSDDPQEPAFAGRKVPVMEKGEGAAVSARAAGAQQEKRVARLKSAEPAKVKASGNRRVTAMGKAKHPPAVVKQPYRRPVASKKGLDNKAAGDKKPKAVMPRRERDKKEG